MKKVFETILEKLKGINFALIGTANMNLQGIKIKPNDIDFLTDDNKNIEKIAKIFSSKIINEYGYKETKFEINKMPINFASKLSDNLRKDDLSEPIFIKKFGLNIPAMPLESELKFYRKLNRHKARQKVKLLEEFLSKK